MTATEMWARYEAFKLGWLDGASPSLRTCLPDLKYKEEYLQGREAGLIAFDLAMDAKLENLRADDHEKITGK